MLQQSLVVEPGDDLPLGGGDARSNEEEACSSQGHHLEGQEYGAQHWNIIIFDKYYLKQVVDKLLFIQLGTLLSREFVYQLRIWYKLFTMILDKFNNFSHIVCLISPQ